GLAPVWVVMACTLGLGVVSAFSAPASQALIGDLVPRADLQSAVALNSMTYNLARAVGPALAALSVRKLGIPVSFAINSASYLVLVGGVLVVSTAPRRRASRAETRLRESLRLGREPCRRRDRGRVRRAGRGRRARPARARRRRRDLLLTTTSQLHYESGVASRGMELHFIADDLEEHAWYVDLVADFIEDVEAFV